MSLQTINTITQEKLVKAYSINFGPKRPSTHGVLRLVPQMFGITTTSLGRVPSHLNSQKRFMFRAAVNFGKKMVPPEEYPNFFRNTFYAGVAGTSGVAANYFLTRNNHKAPEEDFGTILAAAKKHGYTVEFKPLPKHPDEFPVTTSASSASAPTAPSFNPAKGDTVLPSMVENFSENTTSFSFEETVLVAISLLGVALFFINIYYLHRYKTPLKEETNLDKLKRESKLENTRSTLRVMSYSFFGSALGFWILNHLHITLSTL